MRPALAALLAAALAASCAAPGGGSPRAAATAPAAPAPGAAAVPLRNASFEEPMAADARCAPGWSCTMHNDPDSFRFTLEAGAPGAGGRSLCIERVTDEPWALATQMAPLAAVRGARVRLSMAVKAATLAGPGFGPWILVQARPRLHDSRLLRAAPEWRRVALEFAVPANAEVVEVGATLEGPGKACLDDVRLEILAAPPGARSPR